MFSSMNTASADVQLPGNFGDTPQCLRWSPSTLALAIGSWDSTLKIYEVNQMGQPVPKTQSQFAAPVLDCAFSQDGSKTFAAVADKTVQMLDLGSGATQQVGAHDAPVKLVRYIPQYNGIMTGSWDKTLRFWDLRSPQPLATLQLPERCYAGDATGNLAAIATADRKIVVYNLSGSPVKHMDMESKLKMQHRTLACQPSQTGITYGSIEGRTAVHSVDPARFKDDKVTFSFRCHRHANDVYAVNAICFHPVFNSTFCTAGSDGCYNFWSAEKKSRIKSFSPFKPSTHGKPQTQITCAGFSGDGTYFAYGYGYDWSFGSGEKSNSSVQPGVRLTKVTEADVTPKPSK